MSDTERSSNSRPLPSAGGTRKRPANGVDATKAVRRYLSALDATKPGRSVRRTVEAVASRIVKIDELLVSADPLSRLLLTQERIDLHAEHVRLTTAATGGTEEFEVDFVKVARAFGDRMGVTYAAWRQVGVEADVLERAGIHRTRPPQPRSDRPSTAGTAPRKPASAPEPEAPAVEGLPEAAFADAGVDEPASETLWEVESDDVAVARPANGTASHDSPPMRRKRTGGTPAAE